MNETEAILTGDIGGTNARFAVFTYDGGDLACRASVTLPTASAGSFASLLSRVLDDVHLKVQVEMLSAAVFAVAGPVDAVGQSARLPNVAWEVDLSDIKQPGGAAWRLINDFAAQVFAGRTPAVREHARVIQVGRAEDDATLAAIGAGTGLGCCALVRGGDGKYLAVPSEAAHQEFPFVTPDERRFEAMVRVTNGDVPPSYDSIVCGKGLSLLHAFFTGEKNRSPADVAAGLSGNSPVTQWFARFYGRACRNYALAVLPMGGLYICGGLAAKHPLLVDNPIFRQERLASRHHRPLLQHIPVYLNGNELSGLWGAASYAMQMLWPETAKATETRGARGG